MLSLFGFIFSIGLVFEIVRIIILVFEIVQESLSLSLWFLEAVYKAPDGSFCSLQTIIIIIIIEIICKDCIGLFGGDSKHLRWEA